MNALTKQENLHAAMRALHPRTHGQDCADRYRAIAEWWRLHAEESINPAKCLQYALNQDTIADSMRRNAA